MMTVGPSMANILQFYGHRKAYGLSVSPNPLHRNPVVRAVNNPDRMIRDNELQYVVWDAFSAARSPFFARIAHALRRALQRARRPHGDRPVETASGQMVAQARDHDLRGPAVSVARSPPLRRHRGVAARPPRRPAAAAARPEPTHADQALHRR